MEIMVHYRFAATETKFKTITGKSKIKFRKLKKAMQLF